VLRRLEPGIAALYAANVGKFSVNKNKLFMSSDEFKGLLEKAEIFSD